MGCVSFGMLKRKKPERERRRHRDTDKARDRPRMTNQRASHERQGNGDRGRGRWTQKMTHRGVKWATNTGRIGVAGQGGQLRAERDRRGQTDLPNRSDEHPKVRRPSESSGQGQALKTPTKGGGVGGRQCDVEEDSGVCGTKVQGDGEAHARRHRRADKLGGD